MIEIKRTKIDEGCPMPDTPGPLLKALYRYPVKGLTPEPLERVQLTPGQTIPFDRAYAIENGPGRFDPEHPRHLPKITFLMLMRDERLATLKTRFDDETETLTIFRDGKQVARGELATPLGRQLIEQFVAAYMKTELRGRPKIVHAADHSFSDVSAKCVHIVNLASVRELERAAGRTVDPLRFRANFYLEGLEPWAEFGWLDKDLRVGETRLSVFARTTRCEATNVDPESGARDMAIPALLSRTWGHSDFGIYAKVAAGGEIITGSSTVALA
jgi:uncharacterized protein